MLKFSANLTFLFNEVEFLDRFARAAKAGFRAVEFMFPYEWEKDKLAGILGKLELQMVLFNLPAGNWAAGERGIACLPERRAEFRQGVHTAVQYAKALNCPNINCLIGAPSKGLSAAEVKRTAVDNLLFAATELEKENVRLLIEPLNLLDMPGFYLTHTGQALDLIKEIGHPNIWLQYDVYHMQVMEGDLTRTILSNLAKIAHIQVADNPGRHEPGTGEINFPNLLKSIDQAGYGGWIGCEYKPLRATEEGLAWLDGFRPF